MMKSVHTKFCRWCGETKDISSFHKHKAMADGHLNKCSSCVLKTVKLWRQENPDCRKKEHQRNREKYNIRTREQYYKDRFPNPIGREASSLKYVHKRKRNILNQYTNEFDDFVLEEASKLSRLRAKSTGIKWSIDHIVPIHHPLACGLNSYHNIQVVPSVWNSKKGNRNMDVFFEITGY